MAAAENNKLVEVFAGTSSQVAILKSLLERRRYTGFCERQHHGNIGSLVRIAWRSRFGKTVCY